MATTTELQHVRRAFWQAIREGLPTVAAAKRSSVSQDRGFRWFRECGGVSPVELSEPSDRYLRLAEREEIACGLERGESMRAIGRRIGRCAALSDGLCKSSWSESEAGALVGSTL